MTFKLVALAALPLVLIATQAGHCQGRYTISDETAAEPGSPDVVVLHDNIAGAEAAIAPSQGGELSSYRVKVLGQSIELIYRARDYRPQPGFRGKASNLWPAVGAQYPVGTIPKQSWHLRCCRQNLPDALPRLCQGPCLEGGQPIS